MAVCTIQRASRRPAAVATASPVGSGGSPRSSHALAVGKHVQAGGARDGAVHPAAGAKRRVRGVHDDVGRLPRDVPRSSRMRGAIGPSADGARARAASHRHAPDSRYAAAMEFDLLVLGDVNPDLVLRGDDVAPAFGQAGGSSTRPTSRSAALGAIVACGAAKLGLRVAIAGIVGDDLFGSYMRDRLVERGVHVGVSASTRGSPRASRSCSPPGRPRDPHVARCDRRDARLDDRHRPGSFGATRARELLFPAAIAGS